MVDELGGLKKGFCMDFDVRIEFSDSKESGIWLLKSRI